MSFTTRRQEIGSALDEIKARYEQFLGAEDRYYRSLADFAQRFNAAVVETKIGFLVHPLTEDSWGRRFEPQCCGTTRAGKRCRNYVFSGQTAREDAYGILHFDAPQDEQLFLEQTCRYHTEGTPDWWPL